MNSKAATYQRYGNFIINKSALLGCGNFGYVWRGYLIGQNNSLQPVAIKQSYNETENIKEIETLQVLKHPNIIRYRDYRISGNHVFMVMELCQGGTLDDLLYSLHVHNTGTLITYFSQILSGVKFMYQNNILHRDIKPSNILVTKKNVIKIADFGSSKMHQSSTLLLKTLVGTPLFFSPELLQMSLGKEDTYTQKSQIWALGLILYYMFNYDYSIDKAGERIKQSLPWSGRSTVQILKNIQSQPLKFRKQQQIPEQIKQIIKKMLIVNSRQRMSFKQLFNIQIFNKIDNTSNLLNQQQDDLTINLTNKQQIDLELKYLLQKKDQQLSNSEDIQQCRQFYQLLISQLTSVLQPQYKQLMFELQLQYYQVCDKVSERCRINEKYNQQSTRFKELQQNKQNCQNNNKNSIGNNQTYLTNENQMVNSVQQKLIITNPNEKLVTESRKYIKNNIQKILNIKKDNNNMNDKMINKINLLYDLFTLITFEKSWETKKQKKVSIQNYKTNRKYVKIDLILQRIKKAAQAIKI